VAMHTRVFHLPHHWCRSFIFLFVYSKSWSTHCV
jgi:hypothetical protein